jgi:Protein of unknown function (DUF1579)
MIRSSTMFILALLATSAPRPASAQELPAELKVLEQRLGVWNSETTIKAANAESVQLKGVDTVTRVLGGRFIQSQSKTDPGKGESTMLVTYDVLQKTYRFWYFDSLGVTVEGSGQWDARSKTLTWSSTLPGIASTSRWRFIKEDAFEWDLVTKDAEGKVLLEMKGKMKRKK